MNVWKSLNVHTPIIGFGFNPDSNSSNTLKILKMTRAQGRIRSLMENSHLVAGSKLHNCLSSSLREISNTTADEVKRCLDIFLSMLPDNPCLLGINSAVNNITTGKSSNRLRDVVNYHKGSIDKFNEHMKIYM